ncbi:Hypothetical predicted protein [Mytilus galloprovincialis]|uniref:Uncharacterized protein n=1 Tax=Mytilus galloprovincialis TaxID=29158 RepID=A0A8B6BED0_MYTGA|nr:Hypothetical predicted protein [Mytilus galloprovincialis]
MGVLTILMVAVVGTVYGYGYGGSYGGGRDGGGGGDFVALGGGGGGGGGRVLLGGVGVSGGLRGGGGDAGGLIGAGSWWCTCRPGLCRKGELTLDKKCRLSPLFPWQWNTCCQWFSWWVTSRNYGVGIEVALVVASVVED